MANAYLALVSPVADTGVAHFLDTASAYTSGTLQSWRANGAEQASVDFEGSFTGKNADFDGKNSTLSGTLSVDGTTDSTSTTTGSIHTDGGAGIALDLFVGNDLTLVSDAAVLNFGVNSDVSLTHVHDTGLLLNGTMAIQFNDASQYINAPSNAILDINATDEIELNATAIDLNGTLDVSGDATFATDVIIGTNPAGAGDIRLNKNFGIFTRNNANDANKVVISENVITGNDTMDIGDNTKWAAIRFHVSTANVMELTSSAINLNKAVTANNAAIKLTGLVTSDPGVAGQLWNDTSDGNTLKVSAG